jgi:V/A-type H+-transporting ATPase subunit I
VHPRGAAPEKTAIEAARETVEIHRRSIEYQNRLTTLHRQIEQLEMWGDVRREQFEQLAAAGVHPKFYSVLTAEMDAVRAELVQPIHDLMGKRMLIAVVQRDGETAELPESAEELEFPTRDRPSICAEAAKIDQKLHEDVERLHVLAHLAPAMQQEHGRLHDKAQYTIAQRGAWNDEAIFAIQGWVPAKEAESLVNHLADQGVAAAVQQIEPGEEEEPPTLIHYPAWANPILALFKILGTTPGYREYDLAPFFMLAMPIFTAMLVGDAGYGLLFILAALLFGKKLNAAMKGKTETQLIFIFGVVTVLWGVISGNYFGVGPYDMLNTGGFWKPIGEILKPLAFLVTATSENGVWKVDDQAGRDITMMIAFSIGCAHLGLAHLRQLIGMFPSQKSIAELGWIGFIFGMFTLVWLMFFTPMISPMLTLYILVASWCVIVLFCHPVQNPLTRVLIGIVSNLMSISGAFGDVLSYIRLMAVGLASYYIASAFNNMACGMSGSLWGGGVIFSVIILVLAHGLNIALCLVAVFAHGVRLNMLEFSTNSGVQWTGYPYAPFRSECKTATQTN